MHTQTSLKILGIFLMLLSFSMLVPLTLVAIYHETDAVPFTSGFSFTFSFGLLCWFFTRHARHELKTRDAFLVTVLFWAVISLFAALPLMLSTHLHLSFTDAVFEAMSGFTTTGASILSSEQYVPHSLRYYLQQLQFLGGMGIIVLAIAILPMLGIGGMQLYRTEAPGPLKDSKLTPRITQTAKALWYIYVGLNVLCAFCLWCSGLTVLDAIGEAFATISTGGFSMHPQGFAYYHSNRVELLTALFMFLGATNFALHFISLQRFNVWFYWRDVEFRWYCYLLAAVIAISTGVLMQHHYYPDVRTTLVKAIFNVTSLITTTGFTSDNFSAWPSFVPFLIMVASIVGGCGASTSGGVKVMRALLLQKQVARELKQLLHPNIVDSIKFGNVHLPDRVIQSMWAFVAAFIGLFIFLYLLLLATGLDITSAFGALVAAQANAGAGIGSVSSGFGHLPTAAKWILIFAMLAGRLEIFTILILFTPWFWQR